MDEFKLKSSPLKYKLSIVLVVSIIYSIFNLLIWPEIDTIINLILIFGFSILLLSLPNLKTISIMLIWFLSYYAFTFLFQFAYSRDWKEHLTFLGGFYYADSIIPILYFSFFPVIGSIIMILLFSFIISIIFLKIKPIYLRNYNNGYIDNYTNQDIPYKTLISRAFYTFLLSIGLFSALNQLGIISLLFSFGPYTGFDEFEIVAIFFPIIIPFSIGIWSVGWSFEDAGLMHFKFSKKRINPLYEIEPIHYRYNSIIKGYAGISTIIYIIDLSINSFGGLGSSFIQLLYVIFRAFGYYLLFIGPIFPAYIIFWKFNLSLKKYLRTSMKTLQEQLKFEYFD